MSQAVQDDDQYKKWLADLKGKLRKAQLQAVLSVNRELLQFYWELGEDIVQKQSVANWGDGFLTQLSVDLRTEFPEIKGFSKRNLEQIRQWFVFWNQPGTIAKQPVSQLASIPWGHNLVILQKCKDHSEALKSSLPTTEELETELSRDLERGEDA